MEAVINYIQQDREARKEIAKKLYAEGKTVAEIVEIMQSNHYTIMAYLDLNAHGRFDKPPDYVTPQDIYDFRQSHPVGSKCHAVVEALSDENSHYIRRTLEVTILEQYTHFARTDKGSIRWADLVINNREVHE